MFRKVVYYVLSCYILDLFSLENWFRFVALPPSSLSARETELVHALGLHLNRVAGFRWGDVVPACYQHRAFIFFVCLFSRDYSEKLRSDLPILDNTGVVEVLVQVVHVFEYRLLARYDNVVDCAEMLRVLWQPNASRVRHNGNVEFRSHKQDGNDFVHAAQTARVDLTNVDCA
jgi:hypothetical protein